MTMWIIIMWTVLVMLGVSFSYLSFRMTHLFEGSFIADLSKIRSFLFGSLLTFGFMGIITLCINFVNAIVCTLYLALIWMSCDLFFWFLQKVMHQTFQHYYAGWIALVLTAFTLIVGWYLNHTIWQTEYHLTSEKQMPDLKIAMFADSHLGTTFDAEGFAKHLKTIQAQNPDMLVIVGDYVDDGTTKEQMIKAGQALGKMKTKYGIYFVFGNHDKGYYGAAHRGFSAQELVENLTKNNVTVLRDETVLLGDSFYLIGRKDFSEVREQKGRRKSMAELIENLDKDKYKIVLDHQPTDYKKQAESEVDLVLSGHTHGGQLFPFNQVGKWIGANDLVYGHEKRKRTDFIVTSGISDWAIRFKTGTKSEYVLVTVKSKKEAPM